MLSLWRVHNSHFYQLQRAVLETVEGAKKVAKVSPLQTRETWEQRLGLTIDDEQQDMSSVCGTVYTE